MRASEGFAFQEHTVTIAMSIGMAVYPDDGTDVRTLLQAADDAMYAVKTQERRRTHRIPAPDLAT